MNMTSNDILILTSTFIVTYISIPFKFGQIQLSAKCKLFLNLVLLNFFDSVPAPGATQPHLQLTISALFGQKIFIDLEPNDFH